MTAVATRPARWWLSALLLAGAALFTVGAVRERSSGDHHLETAAPASTGVAAETGDEGAEATASATIRPATESSEGTVLGINPESTALVVLAVAASAALAAALLRWRRREVVFATIAFAGLFTVFDVAEVFHQSERSRTGLLLVALAVAFTHAGSTLLGFWLLPAPVTVPVARPAAPVP